MAHVTLLAETDDILMNRFWLGTERRGPLAVDSGRPGRLANPVFVCQTVDRVGVARRSPRRPHSLSPQTRAIPEDFVRPVPGTEHIFAERLGGAESRIRGPEIRVQPRG